MERKGNGREVRPQGKKEKGGKPQEEKPSKSCPVVTLLPDKKKSNSTGGFIWFALRRKNEASAPFHEKKKTAIAAGQQEGLKTRQGIYEGLPNPCQGGNLKLLRHRVQGEDKKTKTRV